MKSAADLIVRYSNKILNNRRDALIFVSLFAVLPFTAWLAVTLVALITLRKGKEAGLSILLPAMVAWLVSLVTIAPLETALLNVLITFIPAYIAAGILRIRASWSWVFGSLMTQAFLGVMLMNSFAPDAILAQYSHFLALLSDLPMADQWTTTKNWLASWDTLALAHAFFGIQVLVIGVSASISLLFARFIQSKLFMPGGFKKEMLAFRSGKAALAVLILLIMAAYAKILIAIDLLPFTIFYFLLSGLNLLFTVLAQKKWITMILFIVSATLSPLTMMMIASFFGILDSIFNFRTNFFATARKSM